MIEFLELGVAFAGAIVVTWFWNYKQLQHQRYRHIDESYSKILDVYFNNPNFGDPTKTINYSEMFSGSEKEKYHFFAMRVHTMMESIIDYGSNGKPLKDWEKVFKYHSQLHKAWLEDNKNLHLDIYNKIVLK